MVSPTRSGWRYGGLAVAFGLGWVCASFYYSPVTTPEIPAVVSGNNAARLTYPVQEGGAASPDTKNGGTTFVPIPHPDVGESFREAMAIRDSSDRTLRLQEIIGALPAEQLIAAIEIAKHLPQSDRYLVLNALGERWARIDLKGAVAFAMQNSDMREEGKYGAFLDGLLDKWAGMAPADAVAWVRSLPPSGKRGEMIARLVEAIGRNDPRYAFGILRSQVMAVPGYWAVENLFGSWAERDPQAAAAAANELKGDLSRPALAGLARVMAEKDPRAALLWASNIQVPGDRRDIIRIVAEGWIKSNPAAAITWCSSLEDQELRSAVLPDAIAQLAMVDLSAALAQIQQLPAGEEHDKAVQEAANSLSRRDLREAIKMLDQLPSTPEKARRLSQVFVSWSESEPRAALDWLYKESTPGLDSYIVGNVLASWMQQAPNEVLGWVQALPSGDKRESALTNLAARLASSDRARAEQLFADLPMDAQASAAHRFSATLLQKDPDEARVWAEGLPPGPAQGTAFEIIASTLAERNPGAAAEWLEQLPAGLSRDKGIAGFSQSVVGRDPEAALSWALIISDKRDRDQQVEALAKRWIGTDAAAARKWLRDSPQLTAEQKFRIRGQ